MITRMIAETSSGPCKEIKSNYAGIDFNLSFIPEKCRKAWIIFPKSKRIYGHSIVSLFRDGPSLKLEHQSINGRCLLIYYHSTGRYSNCAIKKTQKS